MEKVLETVGRGLVNVYVTEGCSRQCHYCFRDTGPLVSFMPWPWILELLDAFAARAAEIREKAHPNFRKGLLARVFGWADNDPIRDYHDPVYGKNFADICEAVFDRTGERSFFISTSGWETGSVGEAAALRLMEMVRSRGFEVRYQLHLNTESMWFDDLGRERYVEQMREVFRLARETAGDDWRERGAIGVGYGYTQAHYDPDLLEDIFREDCYDGIAGEYVPTRAEGRALHYPGLRESPEIGFPANLRLTPGREVLLVQESVRDGVFGMKKSVLLPRS
jgi:hypothetical protein